MASVGAPSAFTDLMKQLSDGHTGMTERCSVRCGQHQEGYCGRRGELCNEGMLRKLGPSRCLTTRTTLTRPNISEIVWVIVSGAATVVSLSLRMASRTLACYLPHQVPACSSLTTSL